MRKQDRRLLKTQMLTFLLLETEEGFIPSYHKSQLFCYCFALDFQSVLMPVKNHMLKQI